MNKRIFAFLLLAPLLNGTASAGVIVGGTRIIFNGAAKETTLNVTNPDASPWLIQSWAETEDHRKAPFIFSPPLFRLDGKQKNILRIIHTGGALPGDRESLFWANVKSIPSTPDMDNALQIAIKTQIKLIYRPAALKNGFSPEQMQKLQWRWQQGKLQVTNPTAFYMHFHSIEINGHPLADPQWVAPFAVKHYSLPQPVAAGTVRWRLINDYGALTETFQASYSPSLKN